MSFLFLVVKATGQRSNPIAVIVMENCLISEFDLSTNVDHDQIDVTNRGDDHGEDIYVYMIKKTIR